MLASLFVLIGRFTGGLSGEGAEKKTLNRAGSCDKERRMKRKRNYHIGRPGTACRSRNVLLSDISNMYYQALAASDIKGYQKGSGS